MRQPPSPPDLFPPSEFDHWAAHYDADVISEAFPFTGYPRVLSEILHLADARAGMSVLDLGTGTGNLSELFASLGCDLWCTDFSIEMIARARAKIPSARFILHDLRQPFPPALLRRFDRIVSAYVFHHFSLPEKVSIIEHLMRDMLAPAGLLLIADISFPNHQASDTCRQSIGDQWDDEPYWIAADAQPALAKIGIHAAYQQISNCAGIYIMHSQLDL